MKLSCDIPKLFPEQATAAKPWIDLVLMKIFRTKSRSCNSKEWMQEHLRWVRLLAPKDALEKAMTRSSQEPPNSSD
eukprot:6808722-Lingulodinium_polyedra.AAC.1